MTNDALATGEQAHAETVTMTRAEYEGVIDQRDRYKAAVDAVLGLHRPITYLDFTFCAACWNQPHIGGRVKYPCPTVEAVTEALGGEL